MLATNNLSSNCKKHDTSVFSLNFLVIVFFWVHENNLINWGETTFCNNQGKTPVIKTLRLNAADGSLANLVNHYVFLWYVVNFMFKLNENTEVKTSVAKTPPQYKWRFFGEFGKPFVCSFDMLLISCSITWKHRGKNIDYQDSISM